MKMAPRELRFRDARLRIDLESRTLYSLGQPARLGGRAFDLLEALIERRGRLVPKQELMAVVWPGLVVEENNLQVHVMTLRKLLGADAIVTVSGRGYRFALVPDDEPGEPEEAVARDSSVARPSSDPPPHLIGRDVLTSSICALVRRSDVRLVTLTGAGGSGKSRVALQVTAELTHDFADGSFIVLLAPVRDAGYVASTVAAALNVQTTGRRSVEELLISHLSGREVLLTLDNFEQVVAAAPLIARLLESCPRLKVLVTSRAVLHLSAEHDVVVPPLALPDPHAPARVAFDSPSVQLFVERARAAGRIIEHSDVDAAVVPEICRRLDGLPLAIELAAARMRILSAQALLARLDHRMLVLTSRNRDLPERQRTIRNAIDWSFELLNEDEQELFQRLFVFVSGWSLDAAEAIAGFESARSDTADRLEALVDQSLVQLIEDVNGEPRFNMLDTVREYSLDRFEATRDPTTVRKRHAEYFIGLAERLEPLLTSPFRKTPLAKLNAELNNFRAALEFSILRQSDTLSGLRLAGALPWMWYFAGQFAEGLGWLHRALDLPGQDQHPALRAKALSGAARLAMYSGDLTTGLELAQESVELWRRTDDRRGLAFGLFHLAIPSITLLGPDRARVALTEALTCFRELGDAWGVALAETYLGAALAYTPGTEDEARPHLLEGRSRFAALEDDWGLTTSSHYLGAIALRQGDYASARVLTEEMLLISREHVDNYRIARNLHQLAEIAYAEKKYEMALGYVKESLALNREQGRVGDVAQQLRFLARLALSQDRPDRTVRLFTAAAHSPARDCTLPRDDPAMNERALDAARESIGEHRYEHERAMALAMSWDQAVSWALAD
jgi:predicted ATPase/DNA-binding winged helix-turn-helix (wHTH) protein